MKWILALSLLCLAWRADAQSFSIMKATLDDRRLMFTLKYVSQKSLTVTLSDVKSTDKTLYVQRWQFSGDTLLVDFTRQPAYPISASGSINYQIEGTFYYQRHFKGSDSITLYARLTALEATKSRWVKVHTIFGDVAHQL